LPIFFQKKIEKILFSRLNKKFMLKYNWLHAASKILGLAHSDFEENISLNPETSRNGKTFLRVSRFLLENEKIFQPDPQQSWINLWERQENKVFAPNQQTHEVDVSKILNILSLFSIISQFPFSKSTNITHRPKNS